MEIPGSLVSEAMRCRQFGGLFPAAFLFLRASRSMNVAVRAD